MSAQQELELYQRTIDRLRERIRDLESKRRVDAGRRRIIARALRSDGWTVGEISTLTDVSKSQVYKDLRS